MAARWIDVTVPLRDGMVHWPDNPPVRITRLLDMERGDDCTVTELALGVHSGTHMDAPAHFLAGGRGIETMPAAATIGPARVIEIRDPESITLHELRAHRVRRGERLLFKTRNSSRCWKTDRFMTDFVYLDEGAARWLAVRRVRTIGIDYLSVAGFHRDPAVTHTTLLKAGVWIIEGLDLSKVRAGSYDLICLPLKVVRGDGAPARAFLKPRTSRTRQTRQTR
jgi:arylformamidase